MQPTVILKNIVLINIVTDLGLVKREFALQKTWAFKKIECFSFPHKYFKGQIPIGDH